MTSGPGGAPPLPATPRVLVIDDEPLMVEIVRSVLEHDGGFAVLTATSGEEGLKLAEREVPDLILLDWMMPGLDGLEVCKLLRGSLVTQDIPVIFLTARTEIPDAVEAFRHGASNYLLKPFDAAALPGQLRQALRPKRRK